MSRGIIQPRTLKGFRDLLPAAMLARERIVDSARAVYRSFGFSPIDTPALEYTEILLGKGSEESDKQMYRFTDHGGRDVALRFDLTVPLARFVAQHLGELGTPFKRYHVGPVWRGENTQRGRYREFVQCDFDTIGTTSVVSDIETALVIDELLRRIGIERFTIRINNRKVLTGILERLELAERSGAVLRALDKLAKVGPQAVAEELAAGADASPAQAREVLALATLEGENAEVLARLEPLVAGSERGEEGARELRELLSGAAAAGLSEPRLRLDVSIARGLDYYTGSVYETFLDDLPAIGSVCSGGRYDDLASLYTKERLPGIGASLGLDRLLAALEELGLVPARQSAADVFVAYFDEHRDDLLALAARLRAAGIATELYPEPKKLGAQLKHADRRGHRLAILAGAAEWQAGTCQLKDFATGQSHELPQGELVDAVRRALAAGR